MTPGNGQGPPEHAGPPEHVTRDRTTRTDSGAIEVGDDGLDALADQIDWTSLSPLERYLLLRIEALENE